MDKIKGSYGVRQSIAEPVVGLRTGIINGPHGPKVELVASIGTHRETAATSPSTGSCVVMHMDVEVARGLFVQLRETLDKMNWPLPH